MLVLSAEAAPYERWDAETAGPWAPTTSADTNTTVSSSVIDDGDLFGMCIQGYRLRLNCRSQA